MILNVFAYLKIIIHKIKLHNTKFGMKGDNVQIYPGFNFGHTEGLYLHDNIVIGNNAFINAHGEVEINSGTITGPDLMIFSVNHIYEQTNTIPFSNELIFRKVVIGKNCWIGGRVYICPGVELGDGCVVAGGSVVTKSFPSCSVIGGNPAKVLKIRDEVNYLTMCEKSLYCNFIERSRKK